MLSDPLKILIANFKMMKLPCCISIRSNSLTESRGCVHLIDWIYKSLKNPDAIQRNIRSDMIPILVAL